MSPTQRIAASSLLITIWIALAAVGLVGTWWFNVAFFAAPPEYGYLEGWFANPASSSAAIDVIVATLAACLFMLVEGARLGWAKWAWLFVIASFAIAIAFTLPLFLALREIALHRGRRATNGGDGGI